MPLIQALSTYSDFLRRRQDTTSRTDRMDLLIAAVLTGEGTNSAQVGLTAATSHALSQFGALSNGYLNATILPYVLEFNRESAADRWATLAGALQCAQDSVTDEISALFEHARVPRGLRSHGITAHDLDRTADLTMLDFAFTQNPRHATRADVLRLLRMAS